MQEEIRRFFTQLDRKRTQWLTFFWIVRTSIPSLAVREVTQHCTMLPGLETSSKFQQLAKCDDKFIDQIINKFSRDIKTTSLNIILIEVNSYYFSP